MKLPLLLLHGLHALFANGMCCSSSAPVTVKEFNMKLTVSFLLSFCQKLTLTGKYSTGGVSEECALMIAIIASTIRYTSTSNVSGNAEMQG